MAELVAVVVVVAAVAVVVEIAPELVEAAVRWECNRMCRLAPVSTLLPDDEYASDDGRED